MDWRLNPRPEQEAQDHRGGTLVSLGPGTCGGICPGFQQPSAKVCKADEVASRS